MRLARTAPVPRSGAVEHLALVILEIPLKGPCSPAFDQPQSVGYEFQQMPVVAHQHHGAGEIVDRLDQRFASLDVEMVCRLVEDQKSGRIMGDEGEVQPCPLAAGEVVYRNKRLFLAEAEPAEPRPNRLRRMVGHQYGKVIEGRFVGPHFLDLMLREKSAGELSRPGHAPSDRRQAPGEQTRQCCLAVAVGAEQRDAVVGVEPQIEPRQHRFSRDIADRGPLERDQRRVQLRRIRKDDPRRRLFGRQSDRLQPGQRLEPALGLARL